MKRFFLLLIVPTLIYGNYTSYLSSDEAQYDGKILTLKGNVKLNHELGEMKAIYAVLEKESSFSKIPFSMIHLSEEVFINFQNERELYCDQATLDLTQRIGTFIGKTYPILFRDLHGPADEHLELFCQKVDLIFTNSEEESLLTSDLETLHAKEEVHIKYGQDFALDADQALYHINGDKTLTAYSDNTPCHLTHLSDYVDATKIHIILEKKILELKEATGTILSLFAKEGHMCHFSSDNLFWDDLKGILTLKKNVILEDEILGTLNCDDTMELTQRLHFGKPTLQTITAEGHSIIELGDKTFISHKEFHLDRDELTITGKSPIIEGKTPLNKQLCYHEKELTLYANDAIVEYAIVNLKLEPIHIHLSGDVRILSTSDEAPLRCGIADHLDYHLKNHHIHLKSNEGKQVLFWHEAQNLRLSAQEIVISLDPETKQEIVKGIGTVRFSFSDTEDEILKEKFTHDS